MPAIAAERALVMAAPDVRLARPGCRARRPDRERVGGETLVAVAAETAEGKIAARPCKLQSLVPLDQDRGARLRLGTERLAEDGDLRLARQKRGLRSLGQPLGRVHLLGEHGRAVGEVGVRLLELRAGVALEEGADLRRHREDLVLHHARDELREQADPLLQELGALVLDNLLWRQCWHKLPACALLRDSWRVSKSLNRRCTFQTEAPMRTWSTKYVTGGPSEGLKISTSARATAALQSDSAANDGTLEPASRWETKEWRLLMIITCVRERDTPR